MSETWHVFRIDELDGISFDCPSCHIETIFHADGDLVGRTERQCPGCNRPIPRAGAILHLFRTLCHDAQSAATDDKVVITLRCKSQD